MKKMSKKLLMVAAIIVVLNFNSCSKYEDGPSFTILTKTARLTGEWEVVKIDNEIVNSQGKMILEFEKGGDLNIGYSYDGQSYSYDANWEWSDDKSKIKIDFDGTKSEWDITKLTNSEFCFTSETEKYECEKQ